MNNIFLFLALFSMVKEPSFFLCVNIDSHSKKDTIIINSVFTLENNTKDTLFYPIGISHKVENNCIYYDNNVCYRIKPNDSFELYYTDVWSIPVKYDTVFTVLPKQKIHIFYKNFLQKIHKRKNKSLKIFSDETFLVNNLGLHAFLKAKKNDTFFSDLNNRQFTRSFKTSTTCLY